MARERVDRHFVHQQTKGLNFKYYNPLCKCRIERKRCTHRSQVKRRRCTRRVTVRLWLVVRECYVVSNRPVRLHTHLHDHRSSSFKLQLQRWSPVIIGTFYPHLMGLYNIHLRVRLERVSDYLRLCCDFFWRLCIVSRSCAHHAKHHASQNLTGSYNATRNM